MQSENAMSPNQSFEEKTTEVDKILTEYGVKNSDLVALFPGKLTHKMVQKARTGRRPLSRRMQVTLTEAINLFLQPEKRYKRENLFPRESENANAEAD